MITRRCTQRMFLLKPTPQTTNILEYCVAAGAQKYDIEIHAICVLSNHWHAIITDPKGNLSDFMGYVHKYISKCVNASLGRWENLWCSGKPSAVALEGEEDILDKMVYVLTNPVQAELVSSHETWPGLIGFRAKDSKTVDRPSVYFRANGPMPEQVELSYTKPSAFSSMSQETYEADILERVREAEKEIVQEVLAAGRKFLGVRQIMKQKVTDAPQSYAKHRKLNPRIGAKDKWKRLEAIRRLKTFLHDYREAYSRWRQGFRDVVFPYGTYAMQRFNNVRCQLA